MMLPPCSWSQYRVKAGSRFRLRVTSVSPARLRPSQTLLCFDEVRVGYGRHDALFAHQHENVLPDTMQLAKALGGGVPIGALVVRQGLVNCQAWRPCHYLGGNRLACAAGNAVMTELLKPGFLDQVFERGCQLQEGLASYLLSVPRSAGAWLVDWCRDE